jgi:putative component of toxin-antitoxin plasmid stabilization module
MRTQPYEIRIYRTADGFSPFRQWLDSLRDLCARGRVEQRVNRLLLGNFGDSKRLKNADQ